MNEELTLHELRAIENALQVAFEEYGKAVEHFASVAWALEQGSEVALFASGEAGVAAANRLRDQFQSQRDDCEALLEILHDGEIVRGVYS